MESQGKDRGGRADRRTTGQARWTFLVYMAGDNNLDGAALRDIAEMARAGSTNDVHILVQLDRLEDRKTRRFRITRGGGFKKDCIETFSETNTGDPKVLFSCCQWALEKYPADHYALILWNHGGGWWEEGRGRAPDPAQEKHPPRAAPDDAKAGSNPVSASLTGTGNIAGPAGSSIAAPVPVDSAMHFGVAPRRDLTVPQSARDDGSAAPPSKPHHRSLFRPSFSDAHRSICYDDTSGGDALDNRELRVVLAGIRDLLGRKIDLLGMDACLMNMVEVAWQLRDSVEVIVGSEIEEPFDGWPYAEILNRLTARPRQDAAALARWIVKSYLASYRGKGETVTQSALDLSRIGAVTAGIDALSEILLAALETDAKLIRAAREKSPRFYDDHYIDLLCFVKNLRRRAGGELRSRAEELIAALKPGKGRLILSEGKIGQEVRGAGGLSIYFPADPINPAYRALDFCGACRWRAFLERVVR